jgi:hypothetical protein
VADQGTQLGNALVWASWYGQTGAVKVLLEAGADVHAGDDAPLRAASAKGHTWIAKLLLEAGADVHADGDAPLRLASANGHTETVTLLEAAMAPEPEGASPVSDMLKSFREIGVELTQEQAGKVSGLIADLVAKGGVASPARPAGAAQPQAPVP